MNEYSNSEQKLIAHYGFINIMDNLSAPSMYRLLVETAFMENDQSEYAVALRTANSAFTHRTTYRCTDAFDALIEDALYTDKKRISDRNDKLVEFWNDNIPYIKSQIQHEIQLNKDNGSLNNFHFKWNQLVQQEIFMYNSLNSQLEHIEFDDLCKRRGFNEAQKQFIVKAMNHVGLAETLCSMAISEEDAK